METYLVFIIQCFEILSPDGRAMDNCTVELIDTNPQMALKRAKKLVTKKFYRLSDIIERHYAKP